MGIVYESAIFTIAAACAESTDEGFLAKMDESVYSAKPCEVLGQRTTITSVEDLSGLSSKSDGMGIQKYHIPLFFSINLLSGLNQREWVMQEQALSK
jgi:hypothetical protein